MEDLHGIMEIFTSVILGPLVTLLMEIIKKYGLPGKAVLATLALGVGGAYALIYYLAPVEFTNNIVALAGLTATSAIYAYELILKNVKK